MWSCYLEILRVIHFFLCDLSWTVIFIALIQRQSVTRTLILYRQLAQWWRIRKFFWPPNTLGSPAGNWRPPAAGGHWATAALSSLAGREDNSVLLLCHCRGKLQSSAALFVLPERYGSKSIYSSEMRTRQWLRLVMVCALQSCCLSKINIQSTVSSLEEEPEHECWQLLQ